MGRQPPTRGSSAAGKRPRRGGACRAAAGISASATGCLLAFLPACGDSELRKIQETFEVVAGQPSVDPSLPSVDRSGGEVRPGDFASNAPVQVDAFSQTQVGKVDILWVVDDSGSMQPKQDKVKQNFHAFISKLVENDNSIDYHIGVITSDTYNPAESGRLIRPGGLSKPWIGRDTCAPPSCDPVAKFQQVVGVGTQGAGDEKPLLAAMMALTPPNLDHDNAGFIRDDASLFLIVISDEEDSSCAPVRQAFGGGCSTPLQYGSPDYYARFLEGFKGFGRGDYVTMGAIVATRQDPLGTTPPQLGCRSAANPAEYAVFAPRTVAVATRTGGLATSICDDNYLPALTNLGFLATGARGSFVLSRVPWEATLRVFVTPRGGTRTAKTRGADYDYVRCRNGAAVNSIDFNLQAGLPPAGSVIEAEYTVDVRGIGACP